MSKVEGTGGSREIKRNIKLNKEQEARSNKTLFNYNESDNTQKSYTVKDDDTAFKIARKFNLTIYQLAEANGWKVVKNKNNIITLTKNGKPVNLQAGMSINVKLANNTQKGKTVQNTTQTESQYTVKSGDSPLKIADDNEISIRQLAQANNWEIGTGKDGEITVLKNGKEVVLQKGEKLNLPASVTNEYADIRNLAQLKQATRMSDGFANLITKFEGNPDNNYKPYRNAYQDDNGVWTVGFGYTKYVRKGTKMEEPEAYTRLAKDYVQSAEDLKIVLGEDLYNSIPKPLQEGLIDLIFNKGFEALDVEKLKNNIRSNNLNEAFNQLIFTKSIKTDKEMNGLYKRSLARLALVYHNSDADTQERLKPIIDEFYETCKSKVSLTELNNWWNNGDVEETQQNSQYTVQKGDTLINIAKKLGVDINVLKVLNKNLAPDFKLNIGDTINIPNIIQNDTPKPIEKPLKDEILNIKKLKLSDDERLQKTEEIFDKYAKKYNLPKEAVEIFKKEAKDEYDSWFWIDTDDMTAMAGILDANDAESLYNAINTANDESSETRKFAGLVLNKKINKDNIRELINLAGGTKKFVKLIKRNGDFEVLRHSLKMLLNDNENNTEILKRFEAACEDEKYSDIMKVFDNAMADSPEEISTQLAKTLDKDDDLNSMLYKYQIQRVNKGNILEVLQSNDIISGICEAENDRKTCKNEILRLFNMLDKQYELNPEKKSKFLELVEKEFRDRAWYNPSTWWIGTSDISEAFQALISDSPKPKNVLGEICKTLGISEDTTVLDKLTDKNGKVIPLVENYTPSNEGPLSGHKIVINAGHGGYNPNNGTFDKGAINEETSVNEWMLNRYIAQKVIEKLQEQGAEVVLTAGHYSTVSYKDFGSDLTISLHADSHQGTSGPKFFAHKKDIEDKKLAQDILETFIKGANVSNLQDLKRKEITYNMDIQANDDEVQNIQAKIVDSRSLQILRKNDKQAADEPAVLIEYCNIKNNDEVRNIVFGNLGNDIVNSIVEGIIKYYEQS